MWEKQKKTFRTNEFAVHSIAHSVNRDSEKTSISLAAVPTRILFTKFPIRVFAFRCLQLKVNLFFYTYGFS